MVDDLKHNEVVAVVVDRCRAVLQEVLSETISDHYSQNDWQSIATSFSIKAQSVLRRCYDLSTVLAKSDLYTADGAVNMPSVIAAFEQTAAKVESPAKQAQLTHLIQYLKHSYDGLKSVFKH